MLQVHLSVLLLLLLLLLPSRTLLQQQLLPQQMLLHMLLLVPVLDHLLHIGMQLRLLLLLLYHANIHWRIQGGLQCL